MVMLRSRDLVSAPTVAVSPSVAFALPARLMARCAAFESDTFTVEVPAAKEALRVPRIRDFNFNFLATFFDTEIFTVEAQADEQVTFTLMALRAEALAGADSVAASGVTPG